MSWKRIIPRSCLVDDDGEEVDHSSRAQIRKLELLQEDWKAKNRICYGAIMQESKCKKMQNKRGQNAFQDTEEKVSDY